MLPSKDVKDVAIGVALIVGLVVFINSDSFGQGNKKKSAGTSVAAWLRVNDAPETFGQTRNAAEYDRYRKILAGGLKSPMILKTALRAPGIADLPVLKEQSEPVAWLQDHLTVVSPLESEDLLIKMADVDQRQAAKIVNAVVDAFFEIVVQEERAQRRHRIESLQKEIADKEEKIVANSAEAEKQLKKFAKIGDAGLIRERYANSLKLATSVRERKLDNALETAAAKLRVTAQTNGSSSEATQAKLDLAIAEAKAEILQKTAEELRREIDDCIQELPGTIIGPPAKEFIRSEIDVSVERYKELLKELDRLKLALMRPNRVDLLQRASPSE